MSSLFPNPHRHAAQGQAGLSRMPSSAGYDRHQSLPALPRTASAPQPWIQHGAPQGPGGSVSLTRSSSGSSAGTSRAPMPRPPPQPHHPQYGQYLAPQPQAGPYGMPHHQQHPHPGSYDPRPGPQRTSSYQQQPMPPIPGGAPHPHYGQQRPPPPPHAHTHGGQMAGAGPQQAQQHAQRQDSADFEAAMQASQASAREEQERRARLQREQEEQAIAASRREEEERQKRQQEEEEAQLKQALEASQREEEEARERRRKEQEEEERHSQILLEESRQQALREEEERIQREHAEVIARSRRDAELADERRQREKAAEEEMQEAAIQESLREMEDEWRRREDEARAMREYMAQGGNFGSASYWQHLKQDEAYELATRLERSPSTGSQSSPTSPLRARRPLPPTPGSSSLQTSRQSHDDADRDSFWLSDSVSETSHDEHSGHTSMSTPELSPEAEREAADDSDRDDPFDDNAEAPPMYDEVRGDRPPEAPSTIPDHIRFARPAHQHTRSENTLARVAQQVRDAKTPAFSQQNGYQDNDEQEQQDTDGSSSATERAPDSPSIPDRSTSHSTRSTAPARPLQIPRQQGSQAGSSRSPRNSDENSPGGEPESLRSLGAPPGSMPSVPEEASIDAPQAESRELSMQRAMKSTEFGYALEPFSPDLESLSTFPAGRFPNVIRLKFNKDDGSLSEPRAFFVIRAPSWKSLLRALAWYGNSRIEAGPEEVVDNPKGICARVEAEFITPAKVSLATARKASASVCISLLTPAKDASSQAAEKETVALRNASRALDTSYVRQGSTRRVIALPKRAPLLPLSLVKLAQHMHEAHTFSSACPTQTYSSSLHSPRDLGNAVEKHDNKYVAKVQKLRRDEEAQAARRPHASEEFVPHSGRAPAHPSPNGGHALNADDTDVHDQEDELDAGAIEVVDGYGAESRLSLSRMRARVRKRLARRSGDPRPNQNDDLDSWITPFDLTQHG